MRKQERLLTMQLFNIQHQGVTCQAQLFCELETFREQHHHFCPSKDCVDNPDMSLLAKLGLSSDGHESRGSRGINLFSKKNPRFMAVVVVCATCIT